LANKTPEKVASWITQADYSLLLAVEDAKILAVGGVTDAGEITLNYVSPKSRFQGVSKPCCVHSKFERQNEATPNAPRKQRDRPSLLSLRRISGGRPASYHVWNTELPNVQTLIGPKFLTSASVGG
jgi:hypothetical protein